MKDLRKRLLAAFAEECPEHVEAVRGLLAAAAAGDRQLDDRELVDCHRRVHTLKGAARAVGLTAIEGIAHRLESLFAQVQAGDGPEAGELRDLVREALDVVQLVAEHPADNDAGAGAMIARLDEQLGMPAPAGERGRTAPAPATMPDDAVPTLAGGPETVRVSVNELDELLEQVGEAISTNDAQAAALRESAALLRELGRLRREAGRTRVVAGETGAAVARGAPAPLPLEQSRRLHMALRSLTWQSRRLSERMRATVARLRLVPAMDVFAGLRREVSRIAKDEGKKVRVDFQGLATTADRQVLQELRDPVLHLLRNAVSHGIEEPAAREAAGKPATGIVRLTVAADGGVLCIAVADDGRGIDEERVRRRAREAGLLAAGEAIRDEEHLLSLLSEPGLSTARRLTEVSGRGMGMDIVRQAVLRLQGTIALRQNEAGETAIELRVPLSVIGTQLVIVSVAGHLYAIPAHAVSGIHRIAMDRISAAGDGLQAVVDSDEPPVPADLLASLLGLAAGAAARDSAWLVGMGMNRLQRGVVVDAVESVRTAIVQELDPAIADSDRVIGAMLSEDGRVVPVLDPAWLLDAEAGGRSADWLAATATRPPPPRVLIVDDSVTTRTLEKSILEAAGYEVSLAVDGSEALELLAKAMPDIVIADVEMPVMNGFELLRRMKADPDLRNLPVIMVTSRDSDADRHRGLELGADAYLVKQTFDQADLLQAIGRLL